MDKFLKLPADKQNKIVDAALAAFGANGYKKTSVSDIARAAGISKAMVFHYFGTKKALYLYLIELCGRLFMEAVNKKFDNSVTDFFDRIKLAGDIEFEVMEKHPAIISFLKSLYHEKDPAIKPEISTILANEKGETFREKIVFDGTDMSKFRNDVDPKLVVKMLIWLSEGCFMHFSDAEDRSFKVLYQELNDCFDLLKKAFYK